MTSTTIRGVVAFFAITLTACAHAVKTEYIKVSVPVRCEIEIPERPKKQSEPLLTLTDILSYTRKLEIVLNACAGKKENGNER
jgi:hypothetical protein